MKKHKMIFRTLLMVAVTATMTACDNDDLYLGAADTEVLGGGTGNVVYVTDAQGNSEFSFVDFSNSYNLELFARTSQPASGNCTVTFSYDTKVLADYNAGQETEVAAFPQAKVALSNSGSVTIASGKIQSDALTVTMTSDGTLDPTATYAIPFKVTVTNGALKGNENSYIVLVRDCTAFPGTDKTYNGQPGMKIIGVLEVNDVNPLNVMGFTLKESGKQFFDMVVLFSANINFNSQTGRVYLSRNENVQALLDNRAKYLKPLQERGIKVILGILGNHDVSGISTLSDVVAKDFAQEVKQVCDAYELDGVFLDDEYTDYNEAASGKYPGFVATSAKAASRLAYEIRKAQPSKLILSYRYQALYSAVAVDGMQPEDIFDYVLNDYWVTSNPTTTYPGLRQDQAGTGSWNCSDWSQCIPANSNWTKRFSLTGMREDGYGALMIFNFTCNPDFWMTGYIVNDMNKVAQDFWNGELDYDGSWYPKDY